MNDINDLIQIRLDFIQSGNNFLSEKDRNVIYTQCKEYFEKHIPLADFIAIIGKIDNEIASAAFLVIQERPANLSFMTGITGTLWNVMTYPKYRKKGFATQIIQELTCVARTANASVIDLNATENGKAIYQKLGFVFSDYSSMRLKLQ